MNKVVHFEIPADDLSRADKFYQEVFGWKVVPAPMPNSDIQYHMAYTVDVDDQYMPKEVGAINGGLMPRDDTGKTPVLVIQVENLEEHLKKIQANGGKIVMPAVEIPNIGTYARISDTEGNVVGVIQPAWK